MPFLGLNPDDQQRIAYWVDGYAQAKNEAAIGTVAFDKFGQPIGALVEDCKVTPKEDALAEAADSVSGRRRAGEWGLRAILILLVVDIFIVAPIAQGATSVV